MEKPCRGAHRRSTRYFWLGLYPLSDHSSKCFSPASIRGKCQGVSGIQRSPPTRSHAREEFAMLVLRASKLIIIGFLAAMSFSAEAAEECKVFGTAPFCAGHCPAGWRGTGEVMMGGSGQGQGCLTGRKVRCCRTVATPDCRYGTPGCPYPSFGSRAPSVPDCRMVRRRTPAGHSVWVRRCNEYYPPLH